MMSQNKSKLTQKKSKDSLKSFTTTEINNFSIAEEVYKDEPDKLERYKKQRDERGFDDTETWHLDKTVALFLIPRLKRYIEVNNGFPCGETETSFNEKLNFIVKSFEEYYYDENNEQSLELEKERLNNAKKAVLALGELWFDLWW
jgi:uncharacterized protein (DUF2164 family)